MSGHLIGLGVAVVMLVVDYKATLFCVLVPPDFPE